MKRQQFVLMTYWHIISRISYQVAFFLDIFDAGIESFIPQNRDILKSRKDHLWPINYESEEELFSYLQYNQYHYYVIQSSYGMNGWVVSKEMKVC